MRLQAVPSRIRRARRTRAHIRYLGVPRLVVFVSCKHVYGQVIVASEKGDVVLASASTLDKALRPKKVNIASASEVGALVASRAIEKGITRVAFDRSGYKYHGRIKALAEAARNAGLEF